MKKNSASPTGNIFLRPLLKTTLLLFLSSTLLTPVSADILSTIDFEEGIQPIRFAGDSGPDRHPGLHAGGHVVPTIVSTDNGVTPRTGEFMMKTHLERLPGVPDKFDATRIVGKYRSSASAKPYQNYSGRTERGKDYWVGISIFLPADWDMDYRMYRDGNLIRRDDGSIRYASGILFDFHDVTIPNGTSHRRGLPFVIKHSNDGFVVTNRSDKCSGEPCLSTIKNEINRFRETAPMRLGQWNDFVVHVKWSPDSDGIIETWVNGDQVLNSRGPNYHSEHTDDMYPYFKFGLYEASFWAEKEKRTLAVEKRTAYFDELRVGGENSSYSEVAPGGNSAPSETVEITPAEDAETSPSETTPEETTSEETTPEETTSEETTPTESTPIVTPAAPSLTEADSSLVAYYSFNDLSGSTVTDDNGGQHNGSLQGPVTAPGKVGAALSFDGVDDYVDVPGFDVFEGALTLSAWIKADDFGNHEARIISKSTGIEEQDHTWMLSTIENNGSKLRFRLKTNEITTTLFGSTTIPAGEWVHAAATYDGANMRLYFNGVEDASTAKGGTISTNPSVGVRIGDNPVSGSRNFNGLIDELRVHSSALSGDQIKQLME